MRDGFRVFVMTLGFSAKFLETERAVSVFFFFVFISVEDGSVISCYP